MAQIREFIFSLNIPREEMLKWYDGSADTVFVRTHTGLKLRFQARHLQAFVTPSGVQGRFRLLTNEHLKFLAVEKLA